MGSSWRYRFCSTCICVAVVGTRRFCLSLSTKPAVLVRFAIASVLAVCAVSPFVVEAVGQAHQIIWIAPVGRRTIEDVAVQQYFERSPPFAIVAALVVAAAIVLWLCTSARLAETDRQLLALAIAWLVIPTAVILIWSALVQPIYTPRYMCFTAPALALVLGVCIGAVAVRQWVAVAIARRLRPRRGSEFSSSTTQSVCEVRNGLQPGRRSDHCEGRPR